MRSYLVPQGGLNQGSATAIINRISSETLTLMTPACEVPYEVASGTRDTGDILYGKFSLNTFFDFSYF